MRMSFLPALDPMTTSLTVRSGAASASWQAGLTGNATIIANRSPLRTAPERIFFDVEVDGFDTPGPSGSDYDPRLHELIYLWDFDEPGLRFDTPEKLLSEWRDANVAHGPFVAHLYRVLGRYTARVTVIEPATGRTAQAAFEVVVEDPAETFADEHTLYVSQSGDFANAPQGALMFDDLHKAFDHIDSAGPIPKRVMLRRGEVWQLTKSTWFSDRRAHFVHVIAEPGSGARPELRGVPDTGERAIFRHRNTLAGSEYAYSGLVLRGGWDSTTETGFNTNYGIQIEQAAMGHVVVDNCHITGCDQAIFESNTDQEIQDEKSVVVNDCHFTNWRGLCHYAAGASRYAWLGTAIVCDPDALAGGPKNNYHNEHGPIRFQCRNTFKAFIDGCDIFNRVGWFRNVGYQTQQPCIRWNQMAAPGSVLNLQRSSLEGGQVTIAVTGVNGDTVENVQNVLIDRCIFVGSHMTQAAIKADSTALTVRNCIAIFPDVERIARVYAPKGFVQVTDNFNPQALTAPMRVYNNSVLNLMGDANHPLGDARVDLVVDEIGLADLEVANNVLHQPNLGVPDVDQGPLSTQILWLPRERGYISQEQPELLAQYASPLDTVQLPRPLEGSPALGNALSGSVSYRDLLGNDRPTYPSMGALERG